METDKNNNKVLVQERLSKVMVHRFVGLISVITFLLYFRFRIFYERSVGVWHYSLAQFLLGHLIWYVLTALQQAGLTGMEKWCYLGHSVLRLCAFCSLQADGKIINVMELLSSLCLALCVFIPWMRVLVTSWKTQARLLEHSFCFVSTVGRMIFYLYIAYNQAFELTDQLDTTESLCHILMFPFGHFLLYLFVVAGPFKFINLCCVMHFLFNLVSLWHFNTVRKTSQHLELASSFSITLCFVASMKKYSSRQGQHSRDVENGSLLDDDEPEKDFLQGLVDMVEEWTNQLCCLVETAFSMDQWHPLLFSLSLFLDVASLFYCFSENHLKEILGHGTYYMFDFTIAHVGVFLLWLERPDIKSCSGKVEICHCIIHFILSTIVVCFFSMAKDIPQVIIFLDYFSQVLLVVAILLKLYRLSPHGNRADGHRQS